MIEDYDNVDYDYFKEWDIEQYKQEIERLNNIIKGLDNTIENLEEVIEHKDSIINKAIKYIEKTHLIDYEYEKRYKLKDQWYAIELLKILKGVDKN